MAQKRMFDKGLLETDAFMDMPMATKALYFLLGMEADDEGFVSPNRVMRIYGGNADDLKVLIAKNYVIQFKTGVVVITDWKENNYLDKNRIKETKYQNEKKLLALSSNKYELLNNGLTDVDPEESRVEENRIEESSSKSVDLRVPEVIKLFEEVNPSYEKFYANKTQRSACARLLKKWSVEQIKVVVGILPELNASQYAKGKSITPLQLEENLGYIKAFIDQRKSNSNKVVKI